MSWPDYHRWILLRRKRKACRIPDASACDLREPIVQLRTEKNVATWQLRDGFSRLHAFDVLRSIFRFHRSGRQFCKNEEFLFWICGVNRRGSRLDLCLATLRAKKFWHLILNCVVENFLARRIYRILVYQLC